MNIPLFCIVFSFKYYSFGINREKAIDQEVNVNVDFLEYNSALKVFELRVVCRYTTRAILGRHASARKLL